MPATVEADQVRDLGHLLNVSLSLCLRLLLQQIVEVVDIGAMVFAVVEFHLMAADYWLQSP